LGDQLGFALGLALRSRWRELVDEEVPAERRDQHRRLVRLRPEGVDDEWVGRQQPVRVLRLVPADRGERHRARVRREHERLQQPLARLALWASENEADDHEHDGDGRDDPTDQRSVRGRSSLSRHRKRSRRLPSWNRHSFATCDDADAARYAPPTIVGQLLIITPNGKFPLVLPSYISIGAVCR
jgi:hypothetical protein